MAPKRTATTNRKFKKCPQCPEGSNVHPITAFGLNAGRPDGRSPICNACNAARQRVKYDKHKAEQEAEDAKVVREHEERVRRFASDHDPLKVEDLDSEYAVGVANDPRQGKVSKHASSQKRQEFNRHMGENAEALRQASINSSEGRGTVLENMPAASGAYIGKLAEQERRFGNRRLARSISLAQAQEALSIQQMAMVAKQFFSGKVQPTGYAKRAPTKKLKRSVVLLLSDLHLGSDLSGLDEPIPFRAVEEARRLEYVMRQAIDYKPQYRSDSELVLLLNGDLIEGQLMHDFRAGAPLTEQKAIFWHLMSRFVGECARAFPNVRVFCQPGNHGRDKVRHPGRATARKWDGHETEMYIALEMMCSSLKNVTWSVPFRAVTAIDLHGSILGLTHGDTEVKLGHPDTAAKNNARELDRINASRVFGVEFDAWAFGHYHTPRYHPGSMRTIYNGALVPPNGHARTSGYIGEATGQFLWEAVEHYPIGDVRFIEVGLDQDKDEKLGTILTPFRFPNQ